MRASYVLDDTVPDYSHEANDTVAELRLKNEILLKAYKQEKQKNVELKEQFKIQLQDISILVAAYMRPLPWSWVLAVILAWAVIMVKS